ncbi:hypothetical protein ACFVVM_32435 [Nocardia sp. NPDC058176]|uniref:hypothetical protein n=1 Tax=Nocardia sp. NPDC058176 TaxID=3346368 RepID=UPI0036DE8CFD
MTMNLPGPALLERACRGWPLIATGLPVLDSVVELVGELGALHRDRLMEVRLDSIDRRRIMSAGALDTLVTCELPPPGRGARAHTETISSVVDRMASWCAVLHTPVATCLTASEVAFARQRVAEIRRGYGALREELVLGMSRLPQRTTLAPVSFAGLDVILRRAKSIELHDQDRTHCHRLSEA